MATTLKITNGTDEVDFNDGTNLVLGSAFQMNVGDGVISEKIISGWVDGIDADAKAVISKRFNRLIRQAIYHYESQGVGDAVYLEWKPGDQTDTQYAKVMGGGEVQIPTHTIGGQGGGVFDPTVDREGAWRSATPGVGVGSMQLIANSTTVYNRVTSGPTRENWLDIPNTRTNDVPNNLYIEVDPGNTGSKGLILAAKRGSETDLDNFNPHFNPDANTSSHTLVADSNGPEGNRITVTADTSITWDISASDLPYYIGAYQVYAVTYQQTGVGSGQVRFIVNNGNQTGKWYDIFSTVSKNLLYLGTFNIPGLQTDPTRVFATGEDLELELEYDITGTATNYFYGIFLVPADIPPIYITFDALGAADEVVIDGDQEHVFLTNAGGQQLLNEATMDGRFYRSHGGIVNRMFLYMWTSSGYEHVMQNTMNIYAVERFLGLRGNT